jgi:hypothetical protein
VEPDLLELTLLTVPDCPNAAAFEERLAAALASRSQVVVRRREIADETEAAEAGMHGSPTLLIDGVDPFAAPGQAPGLACRLYRDATGRPAGVPPVEALRRALEQAGARGTSPLGQPRTPLSATADERNSSVEVHRPVSREA